MVKRFYHCSTISLKLYLCDWACNNQPCDHIIFLNQAHAGQRPVRAWFLDIDLVREVCVCVSVCPPPRLLITSGVIWTPYDWLNKYYSFCMAAIVDIVSRCGLRIGARHRNQPNKSKLTLYKPLLRLYSHLKQPYK